MLWASALLGPDKLLMEIAIDLDCQSFGQLYQFGAYSVDLSTVRVGVGVAEYRYGDCEYSGAYQQRFTYGMDLSFRG
jgi:hypothetical protein